MNKKISPVAKKHLKALGIQREPTYESMREHLERRYGTDALKNLDEMVAMADTESSYSIKNKNYDQALYLAGAFHGDILEAICDWICKNQNLFGNSILEVGCDTGIITSFIGKLFPEKRIVAIDRDPNAVKISKKTCERIGVENVQFLCVDVMDVEGTFDTIFLSRVVHECADFECQPLDEAFQRAELCRRSLNNLCKNLNEVVSRAGNVISIDTMGTHSTYLGYIRAMDDAGFSGDSRTHQEMMCKKFEDLVFIETMSFSRKQEYCDPEETFLECFSHHISTHLSHYSLRDAEIMAAYLSKDIISGWEVIENDKTIAHCAIMTHNYDDTCILKYFSESCIQGNAHRLEIYDISELAKVEQDLREITSKEIAG